MPLCKVSGCQLFSWSCLAADLLRKEPPNLLLTLLEPPGAKGHILFEWMSSSNNPTAFGYFAKIMNCYSNDFQDKVLLRVTPAADLSGGGGRCDADLPGLL